jgi:hypothetical protein
MFPADCAGSTLGRPTVEAALQPAMSLRTSQQSCTAEAHLQSAATVWVAGSSDWGRRGARLEGRPASRIL